MPDGSLCSRRMMAEPGVRKVCRPHAARNALNDRIATRATASSGPGPCSGVALDGDATNGAPPTRRTCAYALPLVLVDHRRPRWEGFAVFDRAQKTYTHPQSWKCAQGPADAVAARQAQQKSEGRRPY
jgi:hypothetical protein